MPGECRFTLVLLTAAVAISIAIDPHLIYTGWADLCAAFVEQLELSYELLEFLGSIGKRLRRGGDFLDLGGHLLGRGGVHLDDRGDRLIGQYAHAGGGLGELLGGGAKRDRAFGYLADGVAEVGDHIGEGIAQDIPFGEGLDADSQIALGDHFGGLFDISLAENRNPAPDEVVQEM